MISTKEAEVLGTEKSYL
jgi:hypothetical protein